MDPALALDAGDRLNIVLIVCAVIAVPIILFVVVGMVMVGGDTLGYWLYRHKLVNRCIIYGGLIVGIGGFIIGVPWYVVVGGLFITLLTGFLVIHGNPGRI
jgi:hypothetical protein